MLFICIDHRCTNAVFDIAIGNGHRGCVVIVIEVIVVVVGGAADNLQAV